MTSCSESSIASILSAFGVTPLEVKVYLAVIASGARPAGYIAQKSGLKRGQTYNILESLIGKGIVQEFSKKKVRHFTACAPEALLAIAEQREIELAAQRRRLEGIVPHLENMRNTLAAQPRVRFTRGLEGIREIFRDITRESYPVLRTFLDIRSSWSAEDDPEIQEWGRSVVRAREQRGITWHGIVVPSEIADRALRVRWSRFRKLRALHGVSLPAEIHIYRDKVAMTSTDHEKVGVIVENEPIASTLQTIFDALWAMLPEYDVSPPREGDA